VNVELQPRNIAILSTVTSMKKLRFALKWVKLNFKKRPKYSHFFFRYRAWATFAECFPSSQTMFPISSIDSSRRFTYTLEFCTWRLQSLFSTYFCLTWSGYSDLCELPSFTLLPASLEIWRAPF
jgi:hypothetical protein